MTRVEVFFRLLYGYTWVSAGVTPWFARPFMAAILIPEGISNAYESTSSPALVAYWKNRLDLNQS